MKISNTSSRLSELMQERGIRQVDILNAAKPFCSQYNVRLGKNDLSQYVNGKVEPKQEKLTILGLALNVSEAWLMGYDVPPSRIDTSIPTVPNIIPMPEMHRIPILGRISAGLPLYAEEHIEGYTYTELNGGAEYFALKVSGDSMTAARIHDGDTLIVRRQEVVDNGQIAVVIVGDDEATVKRFYQNKNNITLMPQSTNPIHQPQIYDTNSTNIRVIGLVVKNEITF